MNLLVLGGTIFLGRHLVDAAIARGHRVTIFHRGRHARVDASGAPGASGGPGVEELIGDRRGDLAPLAGRRFDAVIDTSGYTPGEVRATASALNGSVGHYVFVSSISVYPDHAHAGLDENAPVAPITDTDIAEAETLDRENQSQRPRFYELYGPLKAACESMLASTFQGTSTIVRPGLIVGPHDPTDRFTYWPVRFAAGGDVLVPGDPARPVQWIDVRDLAVWTIELIERGRAGLFNATSPARRWTMGDLVEACVRHAGEDTRAIYVDGGGLLKAGVAPWSELPLWVGEESDPSMQGFMLVSVDRAVGEGLELRPLDDTVRDTLAWWRSLPESRPLRAGMNREREDELLHTLARGAVE